MGLYKIEVGDTVFVYGKKATVVKIFKNRILVRTPGGLLYCSAKNVKTSYEMSKHIEDHIYELMCANCENAHHCHNACENCEEYEDDLQKEYKRYGID